MDHNWQGSGASIPAMSAVPHLGSQSRHHSRHRSPRGKVVTTEDDNDEEEQEILRLFRAKKAAKRSAELSSFLLREADNNSAEKIATRTVGGLAVDGGEGVPADA